jgi:Amidase
VSPRSPARTSAWRKCRCPSCRRAAYCCACSISPSTLGYPPLRERLDSVNPRITAIVDCRPDLVRKQADQVDSLLARGNDLGPLAGVPVTVKINIDQAGFATTDGSRLYENRIAKFNSPAVDNMVRAGAVLLGRSNANICHTLVYEQPALVGAPGLALRPPELSRRDAEHLTEMTRQVTLVGKPHGKRNLRH